MRLLLMSARGAGARTLSRSLVCILIAARAAWGQISPGQDTLLVLPADTARDQVADYLRAALRVVETPKGFYKLDLASPYRSTVIRIPVRGAFSYALDSLRYSYQLDSIRTGPPRRAKLTRRFSFGDSLYVHSEWLTAFQATEKATETYHGGQWSAVHVPVCQINIELLKIENLRPVAFATFRVTKKLLIGRN